jgi:hypothetical protein
LHRGGQAFSDPFGRIANRVLGEVRIARGRRGLPVTEERTDQVQRERSTVIECATDRIVTAGSPPSCASASSFAALRRARSGVSAPCGPSVNRRVRPFDRYWMT